MTINELLTLLRILGYDVLLFVVSMMMIKYLDGDANKLGTVDLKTAEKLGIIEVTEMY